MHKQVTILILWINKAVTITLGKCIVSAKGCILRRYIDGKLLIV